MDFATRDRYRHVVEEIAKRSSLSENEVAGLAVEEARPGRRDAPEAISPARGPATLATSSVDRGRQRLERAARMRRTTWMQLRRLGDLVPAPRVPRRPCVDHGHGDEPCRGLECGDGAARRGPRGMGDVARIVREPDCGRVCALGGDDARDAAGPSATRLSPKAFRQRTSRSWRFRPCSPTPPRSTTCSRRSRCASSAIEIPTCPSPC